MTYRGLTLVALVSVCCFALAGCAKDAPDAGGTGTGAPAAATSGPTVTNVVMTDNEDTKAPKTVFAMDTAKIFAFADIQGFGAGDSIKGSWIAVKTEGAPENYKIDEVSMTTLPMMNVANFSLSKPNNGWPIGDYKVDISINGKPAKTVEFRVAPPAESEEGTPEDGKG